MSLTSIQAEFDTFDSADFVARKISRQITGVTKTRIQANTGKNHNTNFTNATNYTNSFGISPAVYSGNYSFTGLIPQNDYTENKIEPLRNEKAELTITCNQESLNQVERLLINSGGTNIKRSF
ncbi:MAG: hypothetical protein LBM93_15420 [Oscillospiraceae bacterium]|jgi:hypothetical protein|nr:hypothetical protein [Oscillospiraceae bacterium]